jgi:hypothetical protein
MPKIIKTHKDVFIKLENILMAKKKNHKLEILKEKDLKMAHIYCKINNLPGNLFGNLIEFYIQKKYKMKKNKSSLLRGDLFSPKNNTNYEVKASNGGINNDIFSYGQIRLTHKCEYILTAYHINKLNLYNLGELYIFKLNKNNIKNLIIKYGNYSHGTIAKFGKINKKLNLNKEYSLIIKYNNKCWHELLKYRCNL